MNKKGSLTDMVFISVVLFFFALSLLFAFKINDSINNKVQTMSEIDTYGKTTSTQLNGYFPGVIDNSFLFFAIAISLVTLVMASLIRIHPVFIFFYLFGLVIIIILSAVFSNVYQTMAMNSQLSGVASQLVLTSKVMNYLPWIVGIMGGLLAIVMYKTWSENR